MSNKSSNSYKILDGVITFDDRTQVHYTSIIVGPTIVKDELGAQEIPGGEAVQGNLMLRQYKNRCFIISIWFNNPWMQKGYKSPHHLLQTLVDLGHVPPSVRGNSKEYEEENIVDVMHKLHAKYYVYEMWGADPTHQDPRYHNNASRGPIPIFYNDWRAENWTESKSDFHKPGEPKNSRIWDDLFDQNDHFKLLTTGQNEAYKKIIFNIVKVINGANHYYAKELQGKDIYPFDNLYVISDRQINRKIQRFNDL